MPYILVTTQIRLETGPCIVGDESSDPEIMKYLQAEQQREKGQFFKVFQPPAPVLSSNFLIDICRFGRVSLFPGKFWTNWSKLATL